MQVGFGDATFRNKTAYPNSGSVPLDANGYLAHDRECVTCGYNLRGLTLNHVCPECGTPVGRSVIGNELRYADPNWVQKLASGMNWIVVSICISFATVLVAALLAVASAEAAVISAVLMGLLALVTSFVGYWMVTTPEPAKIDREDEWSARRLVRITMVIGLAAGVLGTAFSLAVQLNPQTYQPGSTMFGVNFLLESASSIAQIVGLFAVCIYASSLARRIPDYKLAASTRTCMWGMGICYILDFVISIASNLYVMAGGQGFANPNSAQAMSGVMGALAVFGCVFGITFLVFAIWALILILRYRSAASRAASEARIGWYSNQLRQQEQQPPPTAGAATY